MFRQSTCFSEVMLAKEKRNKRKSKNRYKCSHIWVGQCSHWDANFIFLSHIVISSFLSCKLTTDAFLILIVFTKTPHEGSANNRIVLYCYLRYYYDNEDVKNDKEFKNYLNQLSIDGSRLFSGRIGRVRMMSSIVVCLFIFVFLTTTLLSGILKVPLRRKFIGLFPPNSVAEYCVVSIFT